MASKATLRTVAPGEKAAKAKPASLTDAAELGESRSMLAAMRGRIAKAIEDPNCSTRDLASLSKRLMELQREIDAIDAREEQDGGSDVVVEDGEFDASAV